MPALALGWGLGGTYELGLMGVGAVVLVVAVAMSSAGRKAHPTIESGRRLHINSISALIAAVFGAGAGGDRPNR